jgi:hypothetical protein
LENSLPLNLVQRIHIRDTGVVKWAFGIARSGDEDAKMMLRMTQAITGVKMLMSTGQSIIEILAKQHS